MASSSEQHGMGNKESLAPPTEASDIDSRPEVTFNLSGGIIGGKNAFKNRCLALLKTQIGLTYDSWKLVDIAKKDDIWETLIKEFNIPVERKEEILKEMSLQLKTWKKNLRSNYFKGLDISGIKALKDQVPEKEKIPLSQWNEFINRESTEDKMKQRKKGKQNRLKKNDVHCLGQQSYAEKAEEMKRKNPLQQSPERADVYVESRRQKSTGEFHPQAAQDMEKLIEYKSSQDSSSPTSLKDDVLTAFYGKDTRGRTRGVGPVSKTRMSAILPIRSEIQKVKQSNMEVKQDISEIKQSLNLLLKAYTDSQIRPPQQFLPQTIMNPSSYPPATSTSSSCGIFSLSNASKKIANGVIVSTATTGTVVHGHTLMDFERKVQVIDIVSGEEGQLLYLESQGCATTIKETEGGWVVWPIWLLH